MAVSPGPAIWLQCRPLFQSVLHHVDIPVTCPARGMPASGAAGCASGALQPARSAGTAALVAGPGQSGPSLCQRGNPTPARAATLLGLLLGQWCGPGPLDTEIGRASCREGGVM